MAHSIGKPVGKGQPNRKTDVKLVQSLLNHHQDVTGQMLEVTGVHDDRTLAAITAFQSVVVKMPVPDGILSPGGPTIKALVKTSLKAAATPEVPALLLPQTPAPAGKLLKKDYAAAAAQLQCEVAAIQAVADVETGPQGAFDSSGRPTILFERHIFHSKTGGKFDASNPDLSNPVPGGYGTFSAQYPKIVRAAALDLDAALQAASWGTFQILGMNCVASGFESAALFVGAMREGAGGHLAAFCSFVAANPTLLKAIRAKNWAAFARGYNGPAYAQHQYDVRLAEAYKKYSS